VKVKIYLCTYVMYHFELLHRVLQLRIISLDYKTVIALYHNLVKINICD